MGRLVKGGRLTSTGEGAHIAPTVPHGAASCSRSISSAQIRSAKRQMNCFKLVRAGEVVNDKAEMTALDLHLMLQASHHVIPSPDQVM